MAEGLKSELAGHPAARMSVAAGQGCTPMRILRIAIIGSMCVSLAWPAQAQSQASRLQVEDPATHANEAGGSSQINSDVCVQVDVGGHRAGHLDCVTQRLNDAVRKAQGVTPSGRAVNVPSARSTDVVTGVANATATRQRMGNSFGVGVKPQRPAQTVPPPLVGKRP